MRNCIIWGVSAGTWNSPAASSSPSGGRHRITCAMRFEAEALESWVRKQRAAEATGATKPPTTITVAIAAAATEHHEQHRRDSLLWINAQTRKYSGLNGCPIVFGGVLFGVAAVSCCVSSSCAGTDVGAIDCCEDRHKFSRLCDELRIDQPAWSEFSSFEAAQEFSQKVCTLLLETGDTTCAST